VVTIVTATALVMLLAASVRVGAEATKPAVEAQGPPLRDIPVHLRAKLVAQLPLLRAASRIRWAVERRHRSGFAGIALRDGTVELFWKGQPRGAIARAITLAGDTAPVRIRGARYSFAELKTAAKPIFEHIRANPAGPVHSVRIPGNGSGLIVVVDADVGRSAVPWVPVRVKVIKGPRIHTIQLWHRFADIPPFWGGARIVNRSDPLGAECTAGFGVKDEKDHKWLLTAGHCGWVGDEFVNGDRSRYVGRAIDEKVAHDVMVISSNAGGRIYASEVPFRLPDRWAPASPRNLSNNVPVAGWDWTYTGEYLCHSGSSSGTICGLRKLGPTLAGSSYDIRCNCYEWMQDLEMADRASGLTAGVGGDSGGPVFTPYFSQKAHAWRAIAKGTITAAGGTAFGTQPPRRLIYQDFGTAYKDWAKSINPIWQP
jgi:streptogrisin D